MTTAVDEPRSRCPAGRTVPCRNPHRIPGPNRHNPRICARYLLPSTLPADANIRRSARPTRWPPIPRRSPRHCRCSTGRRPCRRRPSSRRQWWGYRSCRRSLRSQDGLAVPVPGTCGGTLRPSSSDTQANPLRMAPSGVTAGRRRGWGGASAQLPGAPCLVGGHSRLPGPWIGGRR